METILMSIHPKWCEKIFNGEKTIEVRKTAPKPPFKVVVYETKGRKRKFYDRDLTSLDDCERAYFDYDGCGKVIGEFICDKVDTILCASTDHRYFSKCGTCLTEEEIRNYCNGNDIFGLHITDLKVYDEPKELCDYKTVRFVRGYHKKNETMVERLQNSKRVEVTYVSKAPQSYMRIQDPKEEI